MAVKAIVFDLGKVIVNYVDVELAIDLARALKVPRVRYPVIAARAESLHKKLEKNELNIYEFCARCLNIKTKHLKKSLVDKYYIDGYRKKIKANPEVMALIERLKKQGFKLALLSNTNAANAKVHREMDLFRHFDVVIQSHEVRMRKPEGQIYDLLLQKLKKLKVKPGETVFIDNKKQYVQAAAAKGMIGIVFKDVGKLKNDLAIITKKLKRRSGTIHRPKKKKAKKPKRVRHRK